MSADGWLLVRAGGRRVGLSLGQVIEVLDLGPVHPVPSTDPAVRGVTTSRGRVVLSLGQVIEVLDLGPVHPVPSTDPAVRGVTTSRGRVVPLVHLATLLGDPGVEGGTAVLVGLGGRRICLEVDEVEDVLRESGLPVPSDVSLPFAAAVARRPDGLVPLLDLTAVGTRIAETATP